MKTGKMIDEQAKLPEKSLLSGKKNHLFLSGMMAGNVIEN